MEDSETPRATLKVKTKNGYSTLITVTEAMTNKQIEALMRVVEDADMIAHNLGFAPVEERGFAKKADRNYTGEVCPKDGGKLYLITTKTGKNLLKCENGKYDFKTKTTSGCNFTAWGKTLKEAEESKKAWAEQHGGYQEY